MTREDILEAVSLMPPQEIMHTVDRACVDLSGVLSWLNKESLPDRCPHSDEFLKMRVLMKIGRDKVQLWDGFTRLVDAHLAQHKRMRFPAPEYTEEW